MTDKPSSRNPLGRLASSLSDLRERHQIQHRPTSFGLMLADRVVLLDHPQHFAAQENAPVRGVCGAALNKYDCDSRPSFGSAGLR